LHSASIVMSIQAGNCRWCRRARTSPSSGPHHSLPRRHATVSPRAARCATAVAWMVAYRHRGTISVTDFFVQQGRKGLHPFIRRRLGREYNCEDGTRNARSPALKPYTPHIRPRRAQHLAQAVEQGSMRPLRNRKYRPSGCVACHCQAFFCCSWLVISLKTLSIFKGRNQDWCRNYGDAYVRIQ